MSSSLKSQPRITIASSGYHFYQKNDLIIQARTQSKKLNMNALVATLFVICSIFLIFPESPEKYSSICQKYYSESICSVW